MPVDMGTFMENFIGKDLVKKIIVWHAIIDCTLLVRKRCCRLAYTKQKTFDKKIP